MTISAIRAAKHLARNSEGKYTQLELQKLLYLSYMFHLINEGSLLIKGSFEAWKWGPVHSDLDYDLRLAGGKPIPRSFSTWKQIKSINYIER